MAKASGGSGSGTPGSALKKKIEEFGLSKSFVSKQLGQNSQSFQKILDGKTRITVEIAFKLAKLFGTAESFWIDLQRKAAIADAKKDAKLQRKLKEIKKAEKQPKSAKKVVEKKATAKKGVAKKAGAKKGAAKKAGVKTVAKKAVVKKAGAKKAVAKKVVVKKAVVVKKPESSPSSSSIFGSDSSSSW
ncbi:MAG: hypothetical protein Ta2B_22710 [Termitinemataceae bacterium]|nr:MAG: hypothetical protein Ta2B_22710 [Termitinemataceae bacterium]